MPAVAPDAGMDAALSYYTDADVMHFCSAEPATYAGIASVSLGSVAPTFQAIANGDVSGRKRTVDAKTGIAVTTGGTAGWVVLAKTGDSTIRYKNPCTPQALTGGGTFNSPAWDIEINDPT